MGQGGGFEKGDIFDRYDFFSLILIKGQYKSAFFHS